MKRMSNVIAGLSSAEYEDFCTWLRECCGMTISDLIELPVPRQNDAYFRYVDENTSDDLFE